MRLMNASSELFLPEAAKLCTSNAALIYLRPYAKALPASPLPREA
jgi:hypothetical protein